MVPNPFLYFDKIGCINLKERIDRYHAMERFFKLYDIPAQIYRMDRHPSNGRIGCFESHIRIIQDAYNEGAKNVLIFEDDVRCMVSKERLHFVVSKCLQYLEEFEYFQFGYAIMPHQLMDFTMCPRYTSNIALFAGNCCHAYCLNRKGMQRILKTYRDVIQTTHIDLYFLDIFKGNYGCSLPLLFDQNFCITNDNEKPTSWYYNVLRAASCESSRNQYMYWISMIKYYYMYLATLAIILIILLDVYTYCKYK